MSDCCPVCGKPAAEVCTTLVYPANPLLPASVFINHLPCVLKVQSDLEFVSAIHDGCTEQLERDHEARDEAEQTVHVLEASLRLSENKVDDLFQRIKNATDLIPALVAERDELNKEVRRLKAAIDPRNRP